jgi:hypothetical protein
MASPRASPSASPRMLPSSAAWRRADEEPRGGGGGAVWLTFGSCISLYAGVSGGPAAAPDAEGLGAPRGFMAGAGYGVPRVELRAGTLSGGLTRRAPAPPAGDGEGGGPAASARSLGGWDAAGSAPPNFAECVFRIVPKVEYAAALLLAEARQGPGGGPGAAAAALAGLAGTASEEKGDARLMGAVAQEHKMNEENARKLAGARVTYGCAAARAGLRVSCLCVCLNLPACMPACLYVYLPAHACVHACMFVCLCMCVSCLCSL